MGLLIAMAVGLAVSRLLFKEKAKRIVDALQTVVTLILIFSMGYGLGSRDDLLSQIGNIGLLSLVYCLVPSIFSIAAVYLLSRIFPSGKKGR